MSEDRPNLKRKRPEPKQKDLQTRLTGKLYHCSKDVRQAAKKARSFETQRLVKKIKTARNDATKAEELRTLELQLDTLKHFSHDRVACTALQTKIRKDKTLSTFIKDQDVLAAFPTLPQTPPDAKQIESRLLSSKALAEEINRTLSELRAIIAPSSEVAATGVSEQNEGPRPAKRVKNSTKDLGAQEADVNIAIHENSEESSDEDEDSGPIVDDAVDEAGWESGTVDGSEFEGDTGNGEGPAPSSPMAKVKSKPKASSITSTFLPSLSVGYIRGSDDSDISDGEAKVADGPRKNRRGQRARRAIWEKKYGHNAKHIKKEAEEKKKSVRSQPPPRKNAHTFKASFIHKTRDQLREPRDHKTTPKRDIQSSAGEPKLHPSWEAKKKAKEKQAVGIVPFQGKKITF